MKRLYAPWRSKYSKAIVQADHTKTFADDCVFCQQISTQQDEEHFILRRFEHCIFKLNLYPYNAGHVLLLPNKHVASLDHLTSNEQLAIITVLSKGIATIQKTLGNPGTNVGINLGRVAGASIPNHLHIHILPRWQGDTNFLPTLANTQAISVDLKDIYLRLKPEFEKL
jgi:ATP adenylyltransferase